MLRYASRAARDLLKVREDVLEASASEAVANEYLRGILDAAESLQEAPALCAAVKGAGVRNGGTKTA